MISVFLRYAPAQVVTAAGVFCLLIIQTKTLGPTDFGLLSLLIVITEIVRALSSQWLNSTLTRLYGTYDEIEKREITGVIFLLSVIFVWIGLLVILCLLAWYDIFSWLFFALVAIFLILKSLFLFCLEIVRLQENNLRYQFAQLTQTILSVVFSLIALNFFAAPEVALICLILSYAFSLFALKVPRQLNTNGVLVTTALNYGLPMMFSGGVGALSSRLDILLIPSIVGMYAVGTYAAQSSFLLGVISLVFMIVALPLYPELIKKIGVTDELRKHHSRYLSLILLITTPAVAGMVALETELKSLFLGHEFIDNSSVFLILALAIYLNNLKGHYFDHGLQFTFNTKKILIISVVSLVLNFCIMQVTLSLYGVEGAAISLLMVNVVSLMLSVFLSIRSGYRFSISSDVWKIFICTSFMYFFIGCAKKIVYMNEALIIDMFTVVVLSIFVYLLLVVLLNVLGVRSFILSKFRIKFL